MSVEDESIIRAHPEIFQTYYHYLAELPRAAHVFAVEAVDWVRCLGPEIARYVLRGYAGLSQWLNELRALAEQMGSITPPNSAICESWASAKFGVQHHITSLMRFMRVQQVRERMPAAEPAAFDPRQLYRMRQFDVLMNIHECERVVERIRSDTFGETWLTDSELGELGAYLVDRTTSACYWIDLDTLALLGLFDEPRSCEEVSGWLNHLGAAAAVEPTFFAPLVRSGVLVSAEAECSL